MIKYLELLYTRVSCVMEASFCIHSAFARNFLVSIQIPNFCAKKRANYSKFFFNTAKQNHKYWTKNKYVYIIYIEINTWGLALPPNPMVTTARTVVAPSWVLAGVSWPFSVFTYKELFIYLEYTPCSLLNYT